MFQTQERDRKIEKIHLAKYFLFTDRGILHHLQILHNSFHPYNASDLNNVPIIKKLFKRTKNIGENSKRAPNKCSGFFSSFGIYIGN